MRDWEDNDQLTTNGGRQGPKKERGFDIKGKKGGSRTRTKENPEVQH